MRCRRPLSPMTVWDDCGGELEWDVRISAAHSRRRLLFFYVFHDCHDVWVSVYWMVMIRVQRQCRRQLPVRGSCGMSETSVEMSRFRRNRWGRSRRDETQRAQSSTLDHTPVTHIHSPSYLTALVSYTHHSIPVDPRQGQIAHMTRRATTAQ